MDQKIKKFIPLFILAGLALVGAGIYIVVNQVGMATKVGSGLEPANFWLGLWQGAIIYLSFIASWFDNNIVLYQANNVGFWYNLGFMIGITVAIGGSAGGSKKRKCKEKEEEKENLKESVKGSE